METNALQNLCKRAQALFDPQENVSITVLNNPCSNGDLSTFLLHCSNCYYYDKSHHNVNSYIERMESFLKKEGYEIERHQYGNRNGSPVEGVVIALRPLSNEE